MKTMARNGPFSRIPVELLEEIVQYCPKTTFPSLCQVSKQFNSPTVRLLYQEINLSSLPSMVRCSLSLASNPSAASAVKTLKISHTPPTGPLLRSFYQTIAKAFHNLSQLLDLELLFHDLNFLHILTTCTFPRLRHFQCYLPYSKALASFLNRHKDINYLQLYPSDNASARDATDHPPKVVLPKLEYLLGSDDCVSALAQSASLRAAFIEWTPVNQAVHECIAALQRSSADSLRVLSCHREGWNLDLLDAISSALPDILVLSITNVLAVDVVPNYSTLETMGTYLTRFTSLRRLIIHSVDPWDFGRPPCWMDRDFARVRTWGMQCPSLVECTLPHGLKWVRARDHIWFPDPTHSKGTEWLADMICSRRFPESEQLIDILEQIVRERAAFGGASNGEPIPAELELSIVRLKMLGRRYRDGGDGESDGADRASGNGGGEGEGEERENSHVSSEEDDVE